MSDASQKDAKQEKVSRALKMIPQSSSLKKLLPIPMERWAAIFASLDEDKIDDFLLLLEEERSMRLDIEKTRLRRHEVNKTNYLHRLEKLRITLERLADNSSSNG